MLLAVLTMAVLGQPHVVDELTQEYPGWHWQTKLLRAIELDP